MSTKVVLFVELYKFYENYLQFEPLYLLALAGRNLINLLYLRLRLASFLVLRNRLPPFLPLVPCSVIESYKCGGTHFLFLSLSPCPAGRNLNYLNRLREEI